MSRFRWNFASNFLASAWTALAQIACVPIYLHLLGVEAYGLIGFHVTLVAVLQVLDLGLGPTMNREMARLSALDTAAGSIRDFSRTVEICYWVLGILLGLTIACLARVIATHWINTDAVPVSAAQQAVTMMGGLVALQWPLSFYQSGLRGLQRQVGLNVVRMVAVTAGTGGAVLVLVLAAPRIEAYFAWQMLVMTGQVLVLRRLFWKCLPASTVSARFELSLLRGVMDFARGMTGIAFFGAILAQMDRVVVSKQMSLEVFAYYSLAATVANGLTLFINPLFLALFPRLSSLVATGDKAGESLVYHLGTQIVSCCVIPAALVLAFFPHEVILAWTGSEEAARNCADVLRLLALGTAVNGLMHLPYALQVAHGWTSIGLRITVVKVLIFPPVLLWAVPQFGVMGAAASWAAINFCYLIVGLPLTHRQLLRGEAWAWVIKDVSVPLVLATAVVFTGGMAMHSSVTEWSRLGSVVYLLVIAGLACSAAVAAVPLVRQRVLAAGRAILNFKSW